MIARTDSTRIIIKETTMLVVILLNRTDSLSSYERNHQSKALQGKWQYVSTTLSALRSNNNTPIHESPSLLSSLSAQNLLI